METHSVLHSLVRYGPAAVLLFLGSCCGPAQRPAKIPLREDAATLLQGHDRIAVVHYAAPRFRFAATVPGVGQDLYGIANVFAEVPGPPALLALPFAAVAPFVEAAETYRAKRRLGTKELTDRTARVRDVVVANLDRTLFGAKLAVAGDPLKREVVEHGPGGDAGDTPLFVLDLKTVDWRLADTADCEIKTVTFTARARLLWKSGAAMGTYRPLWQGVCLESVDLAWAQLDADKGHRLRVELDALARACALELVAQLRTPSGRTTPAAS